MPRMTPDAAEQAAVARNAKLTRGVLDRLQGVDPIEQVAALVTAATMIIETRFAPQDRLAVLNAMLAETILGWAPSPIEARIM